MLRCLNFFSLLLMLTLSLPALSQEPIDHKLSSLEASSEGLVGLAVIDTGSGRRIDYRSHQRFPIGCTSKVIGVAALLDKSRARPGLMEKRIQYSPSQLAEWSPVTAKHVQEGMTLEALSAAAISYSDNTAMNLITQSLGGLSVMNRYAHRLGNRSFRIDHFWPEEAQSGGSGNVFDSSTPSEMAESLSKLALGDALPSSLRDELVSWMKANKTGDKRIRAGVPQGWVVADKTGTGSQYGTTNDIGIIWPPHHQPIVIAIFYTSLNKHAVKREDVVATVTRWVVAHLSEP